MHRHAWILAALVLLAACSSDPDAPPSTDAPSRVSSPTPTDPATDPPADTSRIDGLYHTTITVQDGLAAGLTKRQAGSIDGRAETTFSFGTVRQFIDSGITTDGFMGTFEVRGGRVVLTSVDDDRVVLAYRLKGKELTFTLIDAPASGPAAAYEAAVWTSHPWVR